MALVDVRLVGDILNESFGSLVQAAGLVLLNKGSLPLGLISRYTEMRLKQAQQCVFVLLQHDLVTAHTPEQVSNNSLRNAVTYELDKQAVLSRLYFPMYIQHASDCYSIEGEAIMTELVLHGKLHSEDLIQKALKYPGVQRDKLEEVLQSLMDEQYITTWGILTSTPAPIDEDVEPSKKRKTGVSSSKTTKFVTKINAVAGYCIINKHRFNLHFRNKSIIELVRDKLNNKAALIIRTILELQLPAMAANRLTILPEKSESISRIEVFNAIYPRDSELADQLDSYLDLLSQDSYQLLEKSGSGRGGGSYVVPIKNLITRQQQLLLEEYLVQRFGVVSQRIFRLLSSKKQLEQKTINHLVMAPWNDIRNRLYQMLSAGFVQLQEIAKTTDRTAARTFYLWRVDFEGSLRILTQIVKTSIANLRQRHTFELESHLQLSERVAQVMAHLEEKRLREDAEGDTASSSGTEVSRKRPAAFDDADAESQSTDSDQKLALSSVMPPHDCETYENLLRSTALLLAGQNRLVAQMMLLTSL